MSFTLTTSQAILFKAGANVNTTQANSGALIQLISDMSEATVSRDSKFDWVTNYSDLAANLKATLSDVTSDYAAKLLINNDMSGYTSSGEAVTMINVLVDSYSKGISELKDIDVQAIIRGIV